MTRNLLFLSLFISFLFLKKTEAQIVTKEDSLSNGLVSNERSTIIGGYGEAKYTYDTRYKVANANLTRAVLFVGHKFNNKISFFSETEFEDAKIDGDGGKVALEQAFLKFNLNKDIYITAGLFIPRIGIMNENHLPTTFNGNDRPFVERYVIPSTWRELGIGLYGNLRQVQGLNYSIALVNGLNSAGFEMGTGIREGRFEGRDASAANVAITAALLYYKNDFRFQISTYYGGSAGLTKREADSLQLSYGAFGTPVMVNEANIQYNKSGFSLKALGAMVQIPDAQALNTAYANNVAEAMYGYYVEAGYNIFHKKESKDLTVFARYENIDLNSRIPENGISSDDLKQQYVVAGISFAPIKGAVVKADYVFKKTGEPNALLVVNPFPQGLPFYATNGYINIGLGYSF